MPRGKETILITGATGRLGKKLIPLLLEKGFTVVGCARRSSPELSRFFKEGFIFEKCDLTSGQDVTRLFKKYVFNQVIHLAASIKRGQVTFDEGRNLFSQNVITTLNLVSAARNQRVKKFIFISSMAVYGLPQYLPVDEKHPLRPLDFYGATKVTAELIIQHLGSQYFKQYFILRFPALFAESLKEGALYSFFTKAQRGLDLVIDPPSPRPWDILSAEDAANFIRVCVLSQTKSDGIFNLDYGEKINLESAARRIKKLCRSASVIVKKNRVKNPYFYFDNKKAQKIIGRRLPSLDKRLSEYVAAASAK